MRADGSELQVDVHFECGQGPNALKRTELVPATHLRIETLTGAVPARTSVGAVIVPSGMNALCINLSGTLMARSGPQSRLVLIPPRSITYVRNSRLIVQAARGEHQSTLITWQSGVTPLLDHWLVTRQGNRGAQARSIGSKAIDPHFQAALKRFNEAVAGPAEILEPQVVSFLYEVVSRVMTGLDQMQLAAIPMDLPETIKDLVARVRSNPSLAWPLKEAADAAGYSPFHFSRVFKNLVGYGFHEYVDRCRTECAVEMLCSSDHAVDLIASTCGFGTTQGLRESVKEYLGLVPSELRAVPDAVDFGD